MSLFTRLKQWDGLPFLQKGEESLSYSALVSAVEKVMVLLKNAGVRPGERIPLFFDASPEYLTALVAVFAAGACAVPLDCRMTGDEAQEIVNTLDARILLKASGSVQSLEPLAMVKIELDWECLSSHTDGMIEDNPERSAEAFPDPEGDALLLFSSGSSGKPKGVVRSYRAVLSQAETLSQFFRYTPGERIFCAARVNHSYGLENVLAALYGGSTLLFMEVFDYHRLGQIMDEPCCTVLIGVPFMYELLVKLKRQGKANHSFRMILSAGAPLSEETNRAFEELFRLPIIQMYGSSEVPSSAVNLQIAVNRQYTSVGKPLPGVNLQIVDEEGRSLPPGSAGEIWINSPFAANRYWGQSELTAESFRDGWFCTGDLGYQTEEGLVFIQGRKKNMINVAGNKVNPEEIEALLQGFPGVSEVMVVGVSDPVYGEMVKAIIVKGEESMIDEIALLQYCKGKISDYKLPRMIEFASSLPRTATGKLQRENPEKNRGTLP